MTASPSRRSPRRTTMSDVARAAGVSQSTVSFVINNRRDVAVAAQTRERVLRAAAELNFQPNRAAQSLRLSQSFLVGIITKGIVAGPFNGRIVTGIQHAVHASGQLCMIVETIDDPSEGDEAVASFLAQGVTAIVYATDTPSATHTSPLLSQTRSVFVNCWPASASVQGTVILADEYSGGRKAADAAFAAGHTDVAFIGGRRGEYACIERQRAFVDAAGAAGLAPDTLLQRNGDYSISSGYDLTIEAFRQRRPTALVCGNDRTAVGAYLALYSLGMRVPDDVSVIGFDNEPGVADQLRPALTTVALPHHEMGRRGGAILTSPDAKVPRRIKVPCPFIQRDSLGPPPK